MGNAQEGPCLQMGLDTSVIVFMWQKHHLQSVSVRITTSCLCRLECLPPPPLAGFSPWLWYPGGLLGWCDHPSLSDRVELNKHIEPGQYLFAVSREAAEEITFVEGQSFQLSLSHLNVMRVQERWADLLLCTYPRTQSEVAEHSGLSSPSTLPPTHQLYQLPLFFNKHDMWRQT